MSAMRDKQPALPLQAVAVCIHFVGKGTAES